MHRIQLNSTNEVGTFVFAAAMSRPDEGYDQSKTTVIANIFEAMNPSDEPEGIDEVLDQYQEEWRFPRWRVKVKQERSLSRTIKEPSGMTTAHGCTLVVCFVVAVIVYII
jgi:hypothetical protein